MMLIKIGLYSLISYFSIAESKENFKVLIIECIFEEINTLNIHFFTIIWYFFIYKNH